MKKPDDWRGQRLRTLAERIEHAQQRYRWHMHLKQKARLAGDAARVEKQRIRANSARAHLNNLIFEQNFRSKQP